MYRLICQYYHLKPVKEREVCLIESLNEKENVMKIWDLQYIVGNLFKINK